MDASPAEMMIEPPRRPLEPELVAELREGLGRCPDVAFAHLPQVRVAGQGEPELALFVWLVPGALRSLRMALNLVSEVVSQVLPDERYLDVVILNSAPELLLQVEAADCLLVEREPDERRRALDAARAAPESPLPSRRPWWWPF